MYKYIDRAHVYAHRNVLQPLYEAYYHTGYVYHARAKIIQCRASNTLVHGSISIKGDAPRQYNPPGKYLEEVIKNTWPKLFDPIYKK